ncbi:ABC transporter permease subunit [Enterococcus durans]|uniref:Amino acid ABC transporter permease n=2 Tax=Enterococcus durans TaxID=53345 RepID=A0AB36SBC2_9ENTE|nr:ABC transporter permease subunit [Enterococcus durans]EOT33612.1 amino acid ABC transporter permease [Enterococcus durans ATCC 6056]EOU25552.1 amino acid ABC transporter permease [Enterococcus durans ATCC 6056]PEH46245.1 amino acid ABC transporter permease [Enterococcus durans]QPQ27405.1 ABC transporter permease subunit [Enterococcus durans]QXB36673.1 ABC transporter permease subunit [Enterococcus durans]
MKKSSVTLTLLFAFIFSFFSIGNLVSADEKTPNDEFRVGMEAGYAPFNWSQQTDANNGLPIQGQKSYAGGYDVQIAKKVADGLGKKLVIIQTKWDGLAPALQSGKIDAIIAGMSPTAERKKEIDFTDPYYESQLVVVVQKDGKYANAKSLADLSGAKITAQLNTFHYDVIDQIPGVDKQQAMDNFSAMRTALTSGMIDGYISERPEGVTATSVNKDLKMLELKGENGFQTKPEDVQIAVGMRKGDPDIQKVNQILGGISSKERTTIMDQAIKDQPASTEDDEEDSGLLNDFKTIWDQYGNMFLRGAGLTLFIALIGTIVGTTLGLLIGVFRSIPESDNAVTRFFQKLANLLLSIYIEVFRGTPMMVQAMVVFYGLALAFGISLDRTIAALLIVSINTGAYMTEIVRGGIFAVDPGQFEAAQAIGMTHGQTMRKVVVPQVLRNILPATGNEFVINIKDTAVLSVIGVADLFFQGNSAAGANFQFFQTFTIVGIIYLIMTFTITRILRFVEKKIDGPSAYTKIEEIDNSNLQE